MKSLKEIIGKLEGLKERVNKTAEVVEERLLDGCHCDGNGLVWVEFEHNGKSLTRFLPCPKLSLECERGKELFERKKKILLEALSAVVPNRHIRALKNLRKNEAVEFVDNIFKNEDEKKRLMWLIVGKSGSGKSFLATYILYKFLLAGCRENFYRPAIENYAQEFVRYTTWTSAYRFVTHHHSLVNKAYTSAITVIDDLGEEDAGISKRALLKDMLFYRHEHEKITIITTTLSSEEVSEKYGEKFLNKILDAGVVYEFENSGGEWFGGW